MSRAQRLVSLLPLPLLCGPVGASSQVVHGSVVDALADTPIRGAEVTLLDGDGGLHGEALSDSTGAFLFPVPEPGGTFALRAERVGYETLTTPEFEVAPGETLELELRLGARAVALDPLRVVARRQETRLARDLRGYYERVEEYHHPAHNRIMTREDLERLPQYTVGEVVERHGPRFGRGCTPTVYRDGVRVPPPMVSEMIHSLSVSGIEGLEFHRGIGVRHTRFMDESGCGVLLVWTRPVEETGRPFSLTRLSVAVGSAVILFFLTR